VRLFGFSILCVFPVYVRLFCSVHVLFVIVVLGLVSSPLLQDIGWEECLRNDLFCGE